MPVKSIFRQIESLGFHILVYRADGSVQTIAARRNDPTDRHVVHGGQEEEDEYRAAYRLAETVGIELEDG